MLTIGKAAARAAVSVAAIRFYEREGLRRPARRTGAGYRLYDEDAPLRLEVFSSPGGAECAHAKAMLKSIADEVGGGRIRWREVDILQQTDHAVDLGVLGAPAIAIDGALLFSSLPSPAKLRAELLKRLRA